METRSPITDYRVEVSGWDVSESFFVEKATLEVNQLSECVIYLRRPLRAGLMVFLRLIDSRVRYPTFPVAYRVTEVTSAEGAERSRVILQKLRRRHADQSEARDARSPSELF